MVWCLIMQKGEAGYEKNGWSDLFSLFLFISPLLQNKTKKNDYAKNWMDRWFAILNSFLQTNLIGRKTQPCQKDPSIVLQRFAQRRKTRSRAYLI